jgi:RNA polymerase sigma-70 factor (sigma-E family)
MNMQESITVVSVVKSSQPLPVDPVEANPRNVVAGADSGDFEAVYERNFDPLFRLASMLVSNQAEGEEIAQEAFVRWYARRGIVKDPDSYLRTVVINLSRDGLRRRLTVRRRAHVFEAAAVEAAAGTEAVPTNPLLDVIAGLPARQRAVVLLRYYEGRSERDIATIIGCRPGTVKSLLSRALDALRKEIEL